MTDHTSKIGFDPLETRYPAQQIYEDSNVAYYLASSGADPSWCDAKARGIHKSFKELARALGYRIEKIEPAPVLLATECKHEPFEGRCVHCDVPFVAGAPLANSSTEAA